jgi:hypothetical protein
MINIWIPLSGICLTIIVLGCLKTVRTTSPLTTEEAEMPWKIHRSQTHCHAERWNKIVRRKKIVGFKYECNYRHIEKKPVV